MATVVPFAKPNSLTDAELAMFVKLDGRLDEAAESRDVLADLTDQEKRFLLAWLVCAQVENLLLIECRLDETRESTYEACGAAADVLLSEIEAQGSIRATLERLVTEEIHSRALATGTRLVETAALAEEVPS